MDGEIARPHGPACVPRLSRLAYRRRRVYPSRIGRVTDAPAPAVDQDLGIGAHEQALTDRTSRCRPEISQASRERLAHPQRRAPDHHRLTAEPG